MKLYIKNMDSYRCLADIKSELDLLELHYDSISLGKVNLSTGLTDNQLEKLKINLSQRGYELISDDKTLFIEQVKHAIYKLIHNHKEFSSDDLSDYLEWKTNYYYVHLEELFLTTTSLTIQQYYAMAKIEYAKDLVTNSDLNMEEIADKLNFPNSFTLARQFKMIAGLTLKEYQNSAFAM